MLQLIPIIFAYPAFVLFRKTLRRFSLISMILLVACALAMVGASIFKNTKTIETTTSTSAPAEPKINKIADETILVKQNDTFISILNKQNLSDEQKNTLVSLAKKEKIAEKLKVGQEIKFDYSAKIIDENATHAFNLNKISIKLDKINSLEFINDGNGQFITKNHTIPLKKITKTYKATVQGSIIGALTNAGLTNNGAMNVIKTFSHIIDFQREIKQGDKVKVLAENYYSPENELIKNGRVLYASIKTGGKEKNIYLYSPTGKKEDEQYFSETGGSIKSSLLRTPVNAARISSKFGYRKHPVLGYNKMHKGVDFAARIGTPIHAAGSGIVQFVGWKSGYGRFVLIKHNGTMSTAYAHSSKFAKGLKKGSRVKQGQVIAYVGRSGRVTGPHLHFEVRINGKQVNPSKFKSTPKIKLSGNKLAKFKKFKNSIEKQINL